MCLFRSRSPVTNIMPPIIVVVRSTTAMSEPVLGTKVFTALETSDVSNAAAADIKKGVSTVEDGGGGGGSDDGNGDST